MNTSIPQPVKDIHAFLLTKAMVSVSRGGYVPNCLYGFTQVAIKSAAPHVVKIRDSEMANTGKMTASLLLKYPYVAHMAEVRLTHCSETFEPISRVDAIAVKVYSEGKCWSAAHHRDGFQRLIEGSVQRDLSVSGQGSPYADADAAKSLDEAIGRYAAGTHPDLAQLRKVVAMSLSMQNWTGPTAALMLPATAPSTREYIHTMMENFGGFIEPDEGGCPRRLVGAVFMVPASPWFGANKECLLEWQETLSLDLPASLGRVKFQASCWVSRSHIPTSMLQFASREILGWSNGQPGDSWLKEVRDELFSECDRYPPDQKLFGVVFGVATGPASAASAGKDDPFELPEWLDPLLDAAQAQIDQKSRHFLYAAAAGEAARASGWYFRMYDYDNFRRSLGPLSRRFGVTAGSMSIYLIPAQIKDPRVDGLFASAYRADRILSNRFFQCPLHQSLGTFAQELSTAESLTSDDEWPSSDGAIHVHLEPQRHFETWPKDSTGTSLGLNKDGNWINKISTLHPDAGSIVRDPMWHLPDPGFRNTPQGRALPYPVSLHRAGLIETFQKHYSTAFYRDLKQEMSRGDADLNSILSALQSRWPLLQELHTKMGPALLPSEGFFWAARLFWAKGAIWVATSGLQQRMEATELKDNFPATYLRAPFRLSYLHFGTREVSGQANVNDPEFELDGAFIEESGDDEERHLTFCILGKTAQAPFITNTTTIELRVLRGDRTVADVLKRLQAEADLSDADLELATVFVMGISKYLLYMTLRNARKIDMPIRSRILAKAKGKPGARVAELQQKARTEYDYILVGPESDIDSSSDGIYNHTGVKRRPHTRHRHFHLVRFGKGKLQSRMDFFEDMVINKHLLGEGESVDHKLYVLSDKKHRPPS